MANSLDQLKATGTVVVCDSGDFTTVEKYKPQDATTNPSLILAAAQRPEFDHLIETAVQYGLSQAKSTDEMVKLAFRRLLVAFGVELLKVIPGRVSTEIDAIHSFDKEASVIEARDLIKLYESQGIDRSRILIKLASTWEGIKAAEVLQKEGINCNLTLLFSMVQAVAAAEAHAFLISPFVGRIMDWYKAKTGKVYPGPEDPGVKSVRSIYQYFKLHNYNTIVMGASFRNIDEVVELAGCDYLTISPNLLEELYHSRRPVAKKLDAESAKSVAIDRLSYIADETRFRFDLNEDAMATEKLREGISKFSADATALKEVLRNRILTK